MKNLYVFGTGTVVPFLYQKGLDDQIENFESFKNDNEALNELGISTNLENLEGEKTIENTDKEKEITPLKDNFSLQKNNLAEGKQKSFDDQKTGGFPPDTYNGNKVDWYNLPDEYLASLEDTNINSVNNNIEGTLAAQTTTTKLEKANTENRNKESKKETKKETKELKNDTLFAGNQGDTKIDTTKPTNEIPTENLIARSKTLKTVKNENEIISGITEDNNVTNIT